MYVLSATAPVPSLGVSIPDDPVEQVLILILSCNLSPHQVAEDHLSSSDALSMYVLILI